MNYCEINSHLISTYVVYLCNLLLLRGCFILDKRKNNFYTKKEQSKTGEHFPSSFWGLNSPNFIWDPTRADAISFDFFCLETSVLLLVFTCCVFLCDNEPKPLLPLGTKVWFPRPRPKPRLRNWPQKWLSWPWKGWYRLRPTTWFDLK